MFALQITGSVVANASAQLKAVHGVAEQQGQLQCSSGTLRTETIAYVQIWRQWVGCSALCTQL
jgi:hypothetical protein